MAMVTDSQYRTDMKSDSDFGKPVTAQCGGKSRPATTLCQY